MKASIPLIIRRVRSRRWLGRTRPPRSVLPLLSPCAGHSRDLSHPRRDLARIEIAHRLQLHAARRFAHPHWCNGGHGCECHTVDEHELDVAGEAAATEAPAVAHA